METLHAKVGAIVETAIKTALGHDAPALLRATQDAKFGDLQVNGMLPLAKQTKAVPRELAGKVAEALNKHTDVFASVEVAGPGFINLRLHDTLIASHLEAMSKDSSGGIPRTKAPKKIVVDFSSPNIAKRMHIGHIRSTILGDALVKILRAVGHTVQGDNHLGDWGTQFGLLIVGMRTFGSTEALESQAIDELERIYKLATAKAKEDPAFAEAARLELAKLQSGDADNLALWQTFVRTTRASLERVYARLGITFDLWLGESAYNDMLPGVMDALKAKNLTRESEGAQCIFFADLEASPPELKNFKEPFIVQKRDGAFLYSTTDIATLQYRAETLKADQSIYVVDSRQSHHFRQLFAIGKMLQIPLELAHVGFGSIMGPDNKPLKTRDGEAVMLESVLNEAIERARARILEEGIAVNEADLAEVSRKVGIGAVKYADLRQNRMSDYVFDWDKLISFKGNAGPTIQYAIARIYSLFAKASLPFAAPSDSIGSIDTAPEARTLRLQLARFADAVEACAASLEPHILTDYAFDLTRAFSGFYEACPILRADTEAQKTSRLHLAWLTGRTLACTLELLGIETVERM